MKWIVLPMSALGLALASSASSVARAADPTTVDEAKAIFVAGTKLMDAGDYEHARVKFLAASALVKSPNVLWNLGYTEFRSGHNVEAVRDMRKYAHDPLANPAHVQNANEKFIPQGLANLGDLRITATSGAHVVLDGKDDLGVAPLADPVAVPPGQHHIEGRFGADVVVKDLDIAAGQSISVSLLPPPAAVIPTLSSAPLNDQPSAPQNVAPTPEQPAGDTQKTAPLRIGMTIGFGAAAVASLVGGVAFAASAKSEANDAQSIRNGLSGNPCNGAGPSICATLKSDSDAENRDHTLGIVFDVGAGAFAAAAVLSWFLLPKTVDSRTAVVPMFGPGVAGARWVTTF
jgi:hypothetical protein